MKNHLYLLLLAGLLAASTGCSNDQMLPTAPAQMDQTVGSSLDTHGTMIGPLGGTVVNEDVRVVIPAGALLVPTEIGIERLADGSIDLTPNGQRFLAPVLLTFILDGGKDPARHSIQWLDPASGWLTIPSFVLANRRVAPLTHFSIYHLVSYE